MELSWKQFRTLNHIKDLPLNEQQRRYHFYLEELSNQLYNANKGGSYLLKEDGSFLLLETGRKIEI